MSTADKDAGITMVDVLEEEQAREDDANAVLGGSDDKFCTYSQGYIKRQALYACLTCTPNIVKNPEDRAGVCLACSYHCHENHSLVELYTKRHFRCDCGGPKISKTKCTLDPFKTEVSNGNNYNQNFSGLYCNCHRPYPDPQDSVDDEMIQCIVCEDWYHSRHLGTQMPDGLEYAEMICEECFKTNEFLHHYTDFAVLVNQERVLRSTKSSDIADKSIADDLNIDVTGNDASAAENMDSKEEQSLNLNEQENLASDVPLTPLINGIKRTREDSKNESNEESPQSKKLKVDENQGGSEPNQCKKPLTKVAVSGGVFWPQDWRKNLCACTTCTEMYSVMNVSFLLDVEDTVQSYEEKGKKKPKNCQYENGMNALQSLGHVNQINAITEYNNMKDKLKDYLKTFAESKTIVTEDHIKEFFESMKAKKKPAGETSHFCR